MIAACNILMLVTEGSTEASKDTKVKIFLSWFAKDYNYPNTYFFCFNLKHKQSFLTNVDPQIETKSSEMVTNWKTRGGFDFLDWRSASCSVVIFTGEKPFNFWTDQQNIVRVVIMAESLQLPIIDLISPDRVSTARAIRQVSLFPYYLKTNVIGLFY